MVMNNSCSKGSARKTLISSAVGVVIGGMITLFGGSYIGIIDTTFENKNVSAMTTEIDEKIRSNSFSQTNDFIDIIDQTSSAVVGVVNIQQRSSFYSSNSQDLEGGTGSGVIFQKSGDEAYIVTNNHVIENADKVEVSLESGQRVAASIVGADPLTDLAVLEISSEYITEVAEFGDSSKLNIGEQVVAIGNPLGLQFSQTVTQGIISGVERTIQVNTSEGEWDLNVIQTDAAINPGNSGGALINNKGQVIGINSLKIAESGVEGLGFAIPSNDVIPIVEDLLKHGEVKRPYVGVSLLNASDIPQYVQIEQLNLREGVSEGVVIASVEPSSPAAAAGLQQKDLVVAVNGNKISSVSDFRKYLYTNVKQDEQLEFEIYRLGEKRTIAVKLAETENE
ncbi:S1C family serine protease [Bacillus sp. Marseille-P3661]|uniref:S1C family serine protease n=1 Tax=Bacillus sp. Marseille-P3661 TaxID=1936234 RepID=UPI000C8569AF|nr:S1C family serine protease [Bacillus sp. Marseille-P3661]